MTIDKQTEEGNPRCMIDAVETLDQAIANSANGLEICINNIDAIIPLKQILKSDRNGKNKIYIIPENNEWDVRIQLAGGFAFASPDFLSRIRNIPGVSNIKEL